MRPNSARWLLGVSENSTLMTARCQRCDDSGDQAIVRMSVRVIPGTMRYTRERLCSGCRGHFGFSLEDNSRPLAQGARFIVPSLTKEERMR